MTIQYYGFDDSDQRLTFNHKLSLRIVTVFVEHAEAAEPKPDESCFKVSVCFDTVDRDTGKPMKFRSSSLVAYPWDQPGQEARAVRLGIMLAIEHELDEFLLDESTGKRRFDPHEDQEVSGEPFIVPTVTNGPHENEAAE